MKYLLLILLILLMILSNSAKCCDPKIDDSQNKITPLKVCVTNNVYDASHEVMFFYEPANLLSIYFPVEMSGPIVKPVSKKPKPISEIIAFYTNKIFISCELSKVRYMLSENAWKGVKKAVKLQEHHAIKLPTFCVDKGRYYLEIVYKLDNNENSKIYVSRSDVFLLLYDTETVLIMGNVTKD